MKWYVSQNRKAQGPLSEQRVEMLVNWGRISRAAYVCDEQSSCWVPITRSRFAALLAPPALAHSDPARADVAGRPAPGPGARAWHPFHPWLAFALLVSFCALASVICLQRSASSVPSSCLFESSFRKSASVISSSGRAPVLGRFGG
jgi:hypothetical protein